MVKKDLAGMKINKLLVIEDTNKRASNGAVIWKCLCDCGNISYVNSGNLKSGAVKSCGCIRLKKTINIGDRYDSLTVLNKIENSHFYRCKCDCGGEIIVEGGKLNNGNIKTCGYCVENSLIGTTINNWKILEKTNELRNRYFLYKVQCNKCGNIEFKTISEIRKCKGKWCKNCHIDDSIIGKKFNFLTVLEQYYNSINRKTYCKCKCDCGKITTVEKSNLLNGTTKSCGCLKSSSGEIKIQNILKENNIIFECQKTFDSCRFNKTNALARFDFYLPEFNCLIEYDGQQHFKDVSIFIDSLQEIQSRDKYKNEWCKKNKIKLIRIPYNEYNDITIEYLLDKILKE